MAIYDTTVSVTIAASASLSGAANLGEARVCAIMMPADWTAADLTFQASTDNDTYYNVYDEFDTEVKVEAGEDRYIILEPARWLGARWLKVRSGTAASAVNQGSARVIKLVLIL